VFVVLGGASTYIKNGNAILYIHFSPRKLPLRLQFTNTKDIPIRPPTQKKALTHILKKPKKKINVVKMRNK